MTDSKITDTPPESPAPKSNTQETPAPEASTPESPPPENPAPEASAPESPPPENPAPEAPTPESPPPENPAPEASAPESPPPENPAPEASAPESPPPENPAPEASAPESPPPENPAPEAPAPESPPPENPAPEAPAPESPPPKKPAPEASAPESYNVLARKYRPARLDDLIGQESLVKTLSNALSMGRLAHAFILTGLRGIGKTTTARIIARGLNCTGEDGKGAPTLNPCGVCSSCVDIGAGRHVDIIEMDAASNTGVDDVRDIIDGIGYRPLVARYKIYIIDEVHMLSKSAFNALLKTLEEPPAAVKFIFATTEIRKVPVTVLSRCQRFDLRHVPVGMMAQHLGNICEKESITVDDAALTRIARAAEGSVRDALSILDQVAALSADNITDETVASILGQADRQAVLAIIRSTLAGEIPAALEMLATLIGKGAEAQMVLRDMLGCVHLATRVASGAGTGDLSEPEIEIITALAGDCGVARLVRAWQVLLKGHGEVVSAPDQNAAAEMVIIRLCHIAPLPTPAEVVRKLESSAKDGGAKEGAAKSSDSGSSDSGSSDSGSSDSGSSPSGASAKTEPPAEPPAESSAETAPHPAPAPPPEPESHSSAETTSHPEPAPPPEPQSHSEPELRHAPETLSQIAELFESKDERLLTALIRQRFRPVNVKAGVLEFAANGKVEGEKIRQITQCLKQWTGIDWVVTASDKEGTPTLDEISQEKQAAEIAAVSSHPLVAVALETFPGSTVAAIRPRNSDTQLGESNDNVDKNTGQAIVEG